MLSATGRDTGWLPAAEELDAYEGIRRGDEAAFKAIAEPLHPTLLGLAGLHVAAQTSASAVVLHSWQVSLRGLDRFVWHTPLATWIAGITVAIGRAHEHDAPDPRAEPVAAHPLEAALAALPTGQREVVHGRDVEGWSPRRVCDVFGLPEAVYERRLVEGRIRLHDGLPEPVELGVMVANAQRRRSRGPLDPRVVAVFRQWRAAHLPAWRRLGHRSREVVLETRP